MIKNCALLFFLFAFNSFVVSAQKISITVTGIPDDSDRVYVEGFYGTDKFSVDSFQIHNKIPFITSLPSARQGVYCVRVSDGAENFFVAARDSLIQIKTTYTELMKGDMKAVNSAENEILNVLLQYKTEFKHATDSLDAQGIQIDEFDSNYDLRSREIRNAYSKYCSEWNTRLKQLAAKYPGTYASDIMIPLLLVSLPDDAEKLKYDTFKSFNHKHYFRLMPLENENVLTSTFFEERLLEYLSFYTHHRDDKKLQDDLNFLLDSLSSNPAVKDFIRYALLKHYLNKGPQEIINFLSEKSASEGCENSSPYQTNAAVKNVLATVPGKIAPQLNLKDFDGSERSLSGVLFGKKAGVILFWASWCSHCRDSVPVFYDWYKQYRDKGLEVYAVSLDSDPREWLSFTQSFTPDWVNVSELKGWDSEVVSTYTIRSTPTFIAVDENRKILVKTNYLHELKDALLPVLNKKQ